MATSTHTVGPSEENSHFMKWMLLLVDAGTLLLRDMFDTHCLAHNFSPQPLKQFLSQKSGNIKILVKKGIISPSQHDLLFPQHSNPDSSTFDITLLACLLRYLCGFNTKPTTVWTSMPSPRDLSVEADIARLRAFRNECAHTSEMSMTEQSFKNKWTELEMVLIRLGPNMPGLKAKIDAIGKQTIDPAREQELQRIMQTWDELDETQQRKIDQIKSEMESQSATVTDLTKRINTTDESVESLQSKDIKLEKKITRLSKNSQLQKRNYSKLSVKVSSTTRRQRKYFDLMKRAMELQETKNKMSPEMKSLVSNTVSYMEDTLNDNPYVETEFHQKAKTILTDHNVLVISGHPGEGKTSMAVRLMAEITSSEKCLKIREPSDWKFFDVGVVNINVLLADDMFGPGSMDDRLIKEWEKFLPDIDRATQKGRVKVIFTTRHSILEDAKDVLHPSPIFDDKHIIHLSSEKLSDSEKFDMMKIHLQEKKRSSDIDDELIRNCILASKEHLDTDHALANSGIVFGFPQCVNMFTSNDVFFQRKDKFFSRPSEFFRQYIEDIFRDEKKFLALILIWSSAEKQVLASELDMSSTSHHLKRIAKKFGFPMKYKMVKTVRKSLKMHMGGLVVFSPKTGRYAFSHHVIGDMIGLVVSKKHPEVAINISPRDFVVKYITLNDDKQDDVEYFYIEPYLFRNLSEKLLCLFLDPKLPCFGSALKRFQRSGNCKTVMTPTQHIDAGLIFIDALQNEAFLRVFVEILEDKKHRISAEQLLSRPVMKMSGHFLGRGVYTEETAITLPDYLLLRGRSFFLEQLIRSGTNMKLCAKKHDIELSLMIATHATMTHFVPFLLEHGATVSEEVIYIAAMTQNTGLLQILLEKRERRSKEKSRIVNGNNALTASSKKGLTSSVECLVENGEDVSFRNSDNYDALGKAIIYSQFDICKILIIAGAPLNVRTGKFKRTPLHMACDIPIPDTGTVRLLLESGASPNIKDSKGHFPIHCAAFRNQMDVVKVLLEYDLNLAKQRIVSYSKKSNVNGMTVFHVAVMKKNDTLISLLIDMKADPNVKDCYGRTPLFYAVSLGLISLNMYPRGSILPSSLKLVRVSDVNMSDKQGLTSLHMALLRAETRSAKALIYCGKNININAIDKWGRTPLHIAFKRGLINTGIEMILYYKADVRMVMKDGTSIFHILEKKSKFRKTFYVTGVANIVQLIYPEIDIKDGEITYDSLVALLKRNDPEYLQCTQDLQL